MPNHMPDTGVPAYAFVIASGLLFVGIAALIWFAIPAPDARHRFASPSGRVVLEIGELCREEGCRRVIVSEVTAADGSSTRRGCTVPLTQQHPVLLNAHPLWNAQETAVDIVYADAQGEGGKFTLVIARDCTITAERG